MLSSGPLQNRLAVYIVSRVAFQQLCSYIIGLQLSLLSDGF